MLNFYPGPSRVNAKIPKYILDAYREGVVSINHRSQHFTQISRACIKLLKKKVIIFSRNTTVYLWVLQIAYSSLFSP